MTATIRDREPFAVIPLFTIDGEIRAFVVALESYTNGYVVTEVETLEDTAWNTNGWYYETRANAARAAAFRALQGPVSWEMIRAMTLKGCVSR